MKFAVIALAVFFSINKAEAKYFDFLRKNPFNLNSVETTIKPQWKSEDKECPVADDLNHYIHAPVFHDLKSIAKVDNIPNLNTHEDLRKQFQDKEMLIYYELANKFDPSKRTVIFIPGGPGQDHTFIHKLGPLFDKFTPLFKNYNVLVMDHRGVGCSRPLFPGREPFQSLQMRQAASDIELIRKELGINKLIVWGGSYGTMLSQTYALLYPNSLDRLFLWEGFSSWRDFSKAQAKYESLVVSSVPILKEQYEAFKTKYPDWASKFILWTAEPWYRYTGRTVTVPETFQKLQEALNTNDLKSAEKLVTREPDVMEWMMRSIACTEIFNWHLLYKDEIRLFPMMNACSEFEGLEDYFDYTESLRNITATTFIHSGYYDHVTPVEAMLKMQNRIPHSYMYMDPHTGHGVDKPECFANLTYAFINGSNDEALDLIALSPACKNLPKIIKSEPPKEAGK